MRKRRRSTILKKIFAGALIVAVLGGNLSNSSFVASAEEDTAAVSDEVVSSTSESQEPLGEETAQENSNEIPTEGEESAVDVAPEEVPQEESKVTARGYVGITPLAVLLLTDMKINLIGKDLNAKDLTLRLMEDGTTLIGSTFNASAGTLTPVDAGVGKYRFGGDFSPETVVDEDKSYTVVVTSQAYLDAGVPGKTVISTSLSGAELLAGAAFEATFNEADSRFSNFSGTLMADVSGADLSRGNMKITVKNSASATIFTKTIAAADVATAITSAVALNFAEAPYKMDITDSFTLTIESEGYVNAAGDAVGAVSSAPLSYADILAANPSGTPIEIDFDVAVTESAVAPRFGTVDKVYVDIQGNRLLEAALSIELSDDSGSLASEAIEGAISIAPYEFAIPSTEIDKLASYAIAAKSDACLEAGNKVGAEVNSSLTGVELLAASDSSSPLTVDFSIFNERWVDSSATTFAVEVFASSAGDYGLEDGDAIDLSVKGSYVASGTLSAGTVQPSGIKTFTLTTVSGFEDSGTPFLIDLTETYQISADGGAMVAPAEISVSGQQLYDGVTAPALKFAPAEQVTAYTLKLQNEYGNALKPEELGNLQVTWVYDIYVSGGATSSYEDVIPAGTLVDATIERTLMVAEGDTVTATIEDTGNLYKTAVITYVKNGTELEMVSVTQGGTAGEESFENGTLSLLAIPCVSSDFLVTLIDSANPDMIARLYEDASEVTITAVIKNRSAGEAVYTDAVVTKDAASNTWLIDLSAAPDSYYKKASEYEVTIGVPGVYTGKAVFTVDGATLYEGAEAQTATFDGERETCEVLLEIEDGSGLDSFVLEENDISFAYVASNPLNAGLDSQLPEITEISKVSGVYKVKIQAPVQSEFKTTVYRQGFKEATATQTVLYSDNPTATLITMERVSIAVTTAWDENDEGGTNDPTTGAFKDCPAAVVFEDGLTFKVDPDSKGYYNLKTIVIELSDGASNSETLTYDLKTDTFLESGGLLSLVKVGNSYSLAGFSHTWITEALEGSLALSIKAVADTKLLIDVKATPQTAIAAGKKSYENADGVTWFPGAVTVKGEANQPTLAEVAYKGTIQNASGKNTTSRGTVPSVSGGTKYSVDLTQAVGEEQLYVYEDSPAGSGNGFQAYDEMTTLGEGKKPSLKVAGIRFGIDTKKPEVSVVSVKTVTSFQGDFYEHFGQAGTKATVITLNVKDGVDKGSDWNSVGAGIESITAKGDRKMTSLGAENIRVVDDESNSYNRNVQIVVKESFKGKIYITVKDRVGNVFDEAVEVTVDANGNLKLNVVREDTIDIHNLFSNVRIIGEAPYRDAKNQPLFADPATLTFEYMDSISGVDIGTIGITANGVSHTPAADNFSVLAKDDNDAEIFTQVRGAVTFNQQENDIVIATSFTDNVGWGSDAERIISIDGEKPIVTVTWDNHSVMNEKYYKENRTATISVEERNFDESACEFMVTTTGPQPSISGWSHNGTTHVATVTFGVDADYTFNFRTTDLAKNVSDYNTVDDFVIDKTVPVISVSYDNNSAQNGNYYNEARRAIVTINEHNFGTAEVEAELSAANDGAAISIPSVNGWSASGDIHTASVAYDYDGEFGFSMNYTDLAGNPAVAYGRDEFVVDLTDPEVEIYDVEDRSANNGVIAPGVRYQDTNYDANGVKVSLVGANAGAYNLNGTTHTDANGVDLKLNDFPHVKEADDLYTMVAVVTDLSGRSVEKEVLFSVNRFGSVFILDAQTKALVTENDGYTNQSPVIGVKEISVDDIIERNVSYNRNGEIIQLSDSEYSIQEKGSDSTWKEYDYTIPADNFESEGMYDLTISTKDRATNVQDNKTHSAQEDNSSEVAFVVDKSNPSTVVTGVTNNSRYRENAREVTIDAQDNLRLEKVIVDVDGKQTVYDRETLQGTNGIVTYELENSNQWQNLKVYSVDKAGNTDEAETPALRILVTTNAWVQFSNNVPLMVGLGVGFVAFATLAFIMIMKKRKKEVEE